MTTDHERLVRQIAKIAHEANRAYCETIGDMSQPLWKDAPDWQRDSAMSGVAFHLRNPDATPADSHENWLADKRADGWKYGPTKNVSLKTHPCMLPYDRLPIEQRVKDALFKSICGVFQNGG